MDKWKRIDATHNTCIELKKQDKKSTYKPYDCIYIKL